MDERWIKAIPLIAPFENYTTWRVIYELTVTFLLLIASYAFGIYAARNLPWLLILSIPLTTLTTVRIFIILHDFVHDNLIKNKIVSNILGELIGIITVTPYQYWREVHRSHHRTFAQIGHHDDLGDFITLTIDEFNELTPSEKKLYKLSRTRWFNILILPWLYFLLILRYPKISYLKSINASVRKVTLSIIVSTVGSAILLFLTFHYFGLNALLFAVLIPIFIAMIIGTLLFYIQHNFKKAEMFPKDKWNLYDASLKGTSYFKLPAILAWFTGYIGYHHLHHLTVRIPFYKLAAAYNAIPPVQHSTILTMKDIPVCFNANLFDEEKNEMISFSDLQTPHEQ